MAFFNSTSNFKIRHFSIAFEIDLIAVILYCFFSLCSMPIVIYNVTGQLSVHTPHCFFSLVCEILQHDYTYCISVVPFYIVEAAQSLSH